MSQLDADPGSVVAVQAPAAAPVAPSAVPRPAVDAASRRRPGPARFVVLLWRRKWGLARLAFATSLLVLLLQDNPARLARLQYRALPDFDHLAEARRLRAEGRLDEALLVLDDALAQADDESRDASTPHGPAGGAKPAPAELAAERASLRAQRDDLWRRAKQFGLGALVGTGDSLESLAGALTADMFVLGDVRDLSIQGARLALDGDADGFVVVLSALGVATTVRPDLDWVPAFLKAARKAGCLTVRMGAALADLSREALRTRRFDGLARVGEHLRTLARRATTPGAARILRQLDHPDELARVAAFLERQPRAAFALHVTGPDGLELLKRGANGTDELLLLVARKGEHGRAWLRAGGPRLLRPHPLVGAAKGLYKGNIQRGAAALAERVLDPHGWAILPAVAAWVVLEGALLLRKRRRV